ncbi:MAG: hypothetical protein WAM39_32190 [Bryobacteraceae bacterium]
MRRKYILFAIAALALAGALFYLYGGGQTPSGQTALMRLNPQNVAEIENAFNDAKQDVRVLLLLSPT